MLRLIPIFGHHGVTLAMGVLNVWLMSRLVPPEVYGVYGLFLTLMQLSPLLTHSPLYNFAVRFWQRDQPRAGAFADFLWRTFWRHGVWLAVLAAAVSLLLAGLKRSADWLWLLPFLIAGNLTASFLAIGHGLLYAKEKNWVVFWTGTLAATLRTFLPVGAVLLAGASLLWLGTGFALHGLAAAALLGVVLQRRLPRDQRADPEEQKQWQGELARYGLPFLWIGTAGWLLLHADRWVTSEFFGAERTGWFVMATSMSGVVTTIIAAGLLQYAFPRIFRESDQARSAADWAALFRACERLLIVYLVLAGAGLVALVWLGPYLVGTLVNERYAAAMPLIIPTGMAALAAQCSQFLYLVLQGRQKTGAMLRISLALAGVKTGGSIIAAACGWEWFLMWLTVSPLPVWLLGRWWIRRAAVAP
jgi:O-antigen/teichoic acid export membrane protein